VSANPDVSPTLLGQRGRERNPIGMR
jgi:hypothetical protein